MPEVDIMAACEYVRGEAGMLHMIGAGIDRIQPPTTPFSQTIGVGIRLQLTRMETEQQHTMQLVFQDEDGQRLVEVNGQFKSGYPSGMPPGWPAYVVWAANMGLLIPHYGVYSLELLVDGQTKKSIQLNVSAPSAS